MKVDDECQQEEYDKVAFPQEEEMMSDFLRRCQKKKSEVMLCPRCSVIFDKKAAQNIEGVRRVNHQDGHKAIQNHQVGKPGRAFDPRRYPDLRRPMVKLSETKQAGQNFKPISFKPSVEGSNEKWVKLTDGRKHVHGKWQNFEVERGSSLAYHKEFRTDKRTSHVSENYKGKNHMTKSQWRREQRRRKAQTEAGERDQGEPSTNVTVNKREDPNFVKRNPNIPIKTTSEKYNQVAAEDEMLTDNFDSGSEASLDILVGVVSVMPREFDWITEVEDNEIITERVGRSQANVLLCDEQRLC